MAFLILLKIKFSQISYLVNILLIDVTPNFGNISRWRFVVFYYEELRLEGAIKEIWSLEATSFVDIGALHVAKDILGPFWAKIVVILWICLALEDM